MTTRVRVGWLWGVLILSVLLFSGCATPLYTDSIFQGVATVTPAQPVLVQAENFTNNRLLFIGADGNLYSADPDGGRVLALTADASLTRLYSQPTWSPTGERIAWTRIDGGSSDRLVVSRADGTVEIDTELPFPPFYYSWSSNGERLAYLSNWMVQESPTLALRLVDLTGAEASTDTVATGQPLYFSWSPASDFLLTHTDNREVSIFSLAGRSTTLSRRSGNFGAPQWLADPTLLAYAVVDGAEQQMVIGNLRSGQVEKLTYFNGALGFSLSPDGHKVAYTDSESGQGMNSFGPLLVLDLRSAQFRQLSSQPVIAFFWSPDSTSIFYMTAELRSGGIGLRLSVWNGEKTTDLGRYQPSATFINQYLRFADQYSQSASYWSPDSRHVLFTGHNESGVSGIWVIPADGGPAERVARGVYAAWSKR
ncbi:MAG: PD40 domain-containing protein [Chloroflexi bacterium]|nr:PD40 domain-containing protein [Chloroflexota bacterium]